MIFADRIVANSSEMTHTRREIFHLLLCGAVHQSKTQPSTVKWSKADSLAQHFCECVCAWTITFWCLLFIKYHSEIAFDLIFSSFFYHILCKHFWNWKREGEREREKENENDTLLSSSLFVVLLLHISWAWLTANASCQMRKLTCIFISFNFIDVVVAVVVVSLGTVYVYRIHAHALTVCDECWWNGKQNATQTINKFNSIK